MEHAGRRATMATTARTRPEADMRFLIAGFAGYRSILAPGGVTPV
jgi:hypothetical protein